MLRFIGMSAVSLAILASGSPTSWATEAATNAPPARGTAGNAVSPQGLGTAKFCQVGGYNDGTDWAYVAAKADSFVVGNCHDGWAVNQQTSTVTSGGVPWQGGFFGGSFASCGWTKTEWLLSLGGAGDSSCSNPDRETSEYMTQKNTSYPFDGTFVGNIWNCDVFANVRPWSVYAGPNDFLRTIPQYARWPEGDPKAPWRIRWRYTTKYGGFVMIRDRAIPAGQGNWGFVYRSCLPAALPQ